LFSLPAGTEMFHFPAFPPHTLCVQVWVTPHDWCRVSPFGHPGITAWLTAPPGLSRPPASFIGSWCQGIHRSALGNLTTKMLASTVQFSNNGQPRSASPARRPQADWTRRTTPLQAGLFPQDPTGCSAPDTSLTGRPDPRLSPSRRDSKQYEGRAALPASD
jgi:hypothetical protein